MGAIVERPRLTVAPEREGLYAIGDIHGCLDELLALEERIRRDVARSRVEWPLILYLGDYVDRGPDSRSVIEHISRCDHADGIERIALCGNHDDAFLRFLRNPAENAAWLDFGGDATLRSYGLGHLAYLRKSRELEKVAQSLEEAVPAGHVRFLEQLPVFALHRDRLFVHAGIRPGVAVADQVDGDLLWIREPFLTEGPCLPITVIHGHTAGVEPVFGNGRICIDTGCYATGRLTALKLAADAATVLE